MIIFALIGNSSAKIYRYDQGQVSYRLFASDADPAVWIEGDPAEHLYIASVNPAAAERLINLSDSPSCALTSDCIGDIHNCTEQPAQTGIDRLLNAYAAYREHPSCNTMVADCGTALSISVTTAYGDFLGGAICAGIQTEAKSLHAFTAQLPEVKITRFPDSPIGTNTENALRNGILWQKTGMLTVYYQQVAALLKDKNAAPTQLILTGGWAPLIAPRLQVPYRYDKHLTFRGLFQTVNSRYYDNHLAVKSLPE